MISSASASGRTAGLLLDAFLAGETEEIRWVDVTVGDLIVTVAADAMKAAIGDRAGVRLPVSYHDTVTICRALDCVAPTQAISDAMFAQAEAQLTLVPLVRTAADSAKMTTVEFTLRFHDAVEKQIAAAAPQGGALIAGAWKYWLLHPRIVERGAVNYGFWDKSRKPPRPVQTVGGQHDASHYDYSQLLQPVKRIARRASTGEEVDLTAYIASHDHVPARFLEPYTSSAPRPATFDIYEEVDLFATLTAAGIDVVPAGGWESRGRPGFAPEGIMVHHTACSLKADAPSLSTCIGGRPDLSGPLCHILLSRSGKAHLIAANVANHAGSGAKEVIDLLRDNADITGNAKDNGYADSAHGNALFYGIEVENAGTASDPYPEEQIDALVAICAAICAAHDWPASRVIHHRQWTPRKIDMSFRGDLPGMVGQKMDAGAVSFGMGEDPSEPMWEPEPDS